MAFSGLRGTLSYHGPHWTESVAALAALDGGLDGLDCWRILCPQIAILLANEGAAFVEIGAGQGKAVGRLGALSKLHLAGSFSDLSGHERCLHFQKEK